MRIPLTAFLTAAVLQPRIQKGFIGGTYVAFADFASMSGYLFQSGAIIGAAFSNRVDLLAQVISEAGKESSAIEYIQKEAKNRLEGFEKAHGQLRSLTTFAFEEEWKTVGISSLDFTIADGKKIAKLSQQKVKVEEAGQVISMWGLIGIGFGTSFSELTESLYRSSNEPVDPERWAMMRKAGLGISEKQEVISFEEQTEIQLSMMAEYSKENLPDLVVPLGLSKYLNS